MDPICKGLEGLARARGAVDLDAGVFGKDYAVGVLGDCGVFWWGRFGVWADSGPSLQAHAHRQKLQKRPFSYDQVHLYEPWRKRSEFRVSGSLRVSFGMY